MGLCSDTILISSSRSLALQQINKQDHTTGGNTPHRWALLWTLITCIKFGAFMSEVRGKTHLNIKIDYKLLFMCFSLGLDFFLNWGYHQVEIQSPFGLTYLNYHFIQQLLELFDFDIISNLEDSSK